MNKIEEKRNKVKSKFRIFITIIAFMVFLWFVLVIVEFVRVDNNKKPLICSPMIKDVEDDDEYSKRCYGFGYKYKEYYYNEDDSLSARELVLFFQEFKRGYKNNLK